jgi:hypothetical protein
VHQLVKRTFDSVNALFRSAIWFPRLAAVMTYPKGFSVFPRTRTIFNVAVLYHSVFGFLTGRDELFCGFRRVLPS